MLGGPVPIMHLVDVRTYPTVHAMATHVAATLRKSCNRFWMQTHMGGACASRFWGFHSAHPSPCSRRQTCSALDSVLLVLSVISLAGPHAGTAKWTQGVLKLVRPWPKMAPGVGGLLAGTCVDAWDRVVGELARGTSAVESVVMVGVRGDPLVPEASAVARVGAKEDDEETEASKVRRLVIVPVDGVSYESVDGAEMDSRSALDPGPLAEGRVDIMEVDTHAHAWPRLMTWASLSPAKRPQSATSNSSSGSGKRRPDQRWTGIGRG
ncbi:hypothetical protein BCR44DRAFT_1198292 [Catenaria anguillulae PL171]|uniref:Uncharacterized protein n=1 Tax=Catenaria anguillulae PL171 TaxID=765915 RepID=A0A1Y2HFX5_9FUNG|nr:hypothetical protein BCR44DRAFT_1198292 [Catenaria anguillulae PL171]